MKTTISFKYKDGFWFFSCEVEFGGTCHFWTEVVSESYAREKASSLGMTLPEHIDGRYVRSVFNL